MQNDDALTLLRGLRDDLPDGHPEKAGVIRSIELLRVATPRADQQPPAPGVYEYVLAWSGIDFAYPVPLVPRGTVKVGDTVQSSHGYRGVVVAADTRGTDVGTTTLTLELHRAGSGVRRTESYPADLTIPVLAFVGQPHVVIVRDYRNDPDLDNAGVYGPFETAEAAQPFATALREAAGWDDHEALILPMSLACQTTEGWR